MATHLSYPHANCNDSCVQRSIRFAKSSKMDHFLIQTKSASPNKLVHQMATHLSYPHVTVAEVVKHARPVLLVDIKRTPGPVKRALRIRFQLNRAIKHILFEIL